jgi:outer membrane lipoprotein-sorting protein
MINAGGGRLLAVAAAVMALIAAPAGGEVPDLDATVSAGQARYAQVRDYTCLMSRTEWVERTGQYKVQSNIVLKHRKPGSFYLKWTEGSAKGTETLYVEGSNDGRMFVHYNNIFKFLTFALDPASQRALKNNRHTIREAHLGFFLEMIETNLRRARAAGDGQVAFTGEETLDGRASLQFEARLPQDKGYYGGRVLMNFDRELSLPIKVEVFGWDGRLWERYQFTQLVIDPGLRDEDFNLKNPAYQLGSHRIYGL